MSTSRLSILDAADQLDCHPDTIRRAIARGELRAFRSPGRGRLIRIRQQDLDRWMRPITNVATDLGTGDAA